ncbi:MAG: ABC transporter substrate-binding protein [Devosia sp.]|nr:ABC transporter substrate-binding protein [Devosia sp.]
MIHQCSSLPAAQPHRRTLLKGLAATALAAPALIGRAHAAGEPIRVGLSAPLTLQFAENGKWMRQGAELAVKEVNAAGGIGGRPLQLFAEDDQGPNPTAVANAFMKLVTQDHVVGIVGPHYTPAILADEPLLAQYQVPAFTGATGPAVTAQGNKFVFRVRLNDSIGAKLLVRYLTGEQHWKAIGIDYVNTAFGQGALGALRAEFAAEKIAPVLVQTHLDSTKDFTAQLLAFKQAGAEDLIIFTDDMPMGLMTKQIKTLGLGFGIAGNAGLTLPDVFALAGDATEGAFSIGEFIANNPDPVVQAWVTRYRAAYGADPELYGSVYYDATKLLADAIGRASEVSGPAIQQALTATKGFRGVVTTYTWSPGGDMVHSALITRNQNMQPVIIKSVTE